MTRITDMRSDLKLSKVKVIIIRRHFDAFAHNWTNKSQILVAAVTSHLANKNNNEKSAQRDANTARWL